MKSKYEMTLQKVTCTNSCQHAVNLRSSPFAIRSIYNTPTFNKSKSNTTAVDRRQLHWNVITRTQSLLTLQRRQLGLPFWLRASPLTCRYQMFTRFLTIVKSY